MTTATNYPTASQMLHTLRSKGFRISVSDYCFNADLGEWNIYIVTPKNTFITAVHMQWTDEEGLFDSLRIKEVMLPNGEVCKGEKFCEDRHLMLLKKVMA